MAFGVKVRGDKDIRKAIADLRKLVETDDDRILRVVGVEAVKSSQRNIREKHGPDGEAWAGLKHRRGAALRDTGRLYNSITWTAPLGGRRVRIGTNVVYAALQHFGGNVVPKKGRFLAIPLTPAIRRNYSGSFRRDYPDAVVLRSKTGKLFLARRSEKGKGKKGLELLAILLRSVRVPPRPYLGVSREGWETIRKRVEQIASAIWHVGGSNA